MLLSIKFANFRSYFKPQEFSMLAIQQEKQWLQENTFALNPALLNKSRVFRTSMILGHNAAGKSNLLRVCKYLRYLVLFSSEDSRDKRNIFKDSDERFAFFDEAKDVPTGFEIEFVAENKYYFLYKVEIKNFTVAYESLWQRVSYDGRRLAKIKCLFERRGDGVVEAIDEFRKLLEFIEIKPNVLILSNCNSDIKDDICPSGKIAIRWFQHLHYWNSNTTSIEIYEENAGYLEKATKILQKSDKSLKSLRIKKTKLDLPVESQKDPKALFKALRKSNIDVASGMLAALEDGVYQIDVIAEYNIYDNDATHTLKGTTEFSVYDQTSRISTGQAKLIRYLAYIIEVLDTGGILFLDELDCHLHHQFPKLITDAFNDLEINKRNAQLVFTTHSTNLLDCNFRRDQINIVTKDEFGVSTVAHPMRPEGRVKLTNSLSKLWLDNALNEVATITVADLKGILITTKEVNA
jgi:AAA15 family ATPase/GTPase